MRKTLGLLVAVVVCIAAAPVANAADAAGAKLAVCVFHYGEDSAGRQFAYAIREAARASSGYRLGDPKDCVLQIQLITVDPDGRGNSNSWTAAAVSYTMANLNAYEKGNPQTWYPLHLTTQVLTAGTQRVDEQAKVVMATLDEQVERYRREARNSK